MSGHKWKRLQRATAMKGPSDELIEAWMHRHGCGREEAIAKVEEFFAQAELWVNDLYQVEVIREPETQSARICIRRRDGYVGRDWRHFQQIKNEIVGPECEAIELYPAESRLVDTSNKYHLYACTDPTFRFPIGWEKRDVQYGEHKSPGLRQAPAMQFAGNESGPS